ncbi:helix-turn-helix domain-containing protein [Streptomyces sp. SM13]|uniref:helix-turn-helix domain-containing protein n=1 Tax=Streptomyces sp. SM13 TaxID=1983803 RepID=UPI000CD5A874|nr:helix-turn-helix domain-containing protein [Streptomyces sp. SM13]
MNTTTAAQTANVTVVTIRAWARNGVIAATKTAGRWIIDAASLARRITIGTWRTTVTEQPKYRIETARITRYNKEITVYRVVFTGEGTEWRTRNAEFADQATAELHREFFENTPTCYRIDRSTQGKHPQWFLTGGIDGDPTPLRTFLKIQLGNAGQAATLVRLATEHASGAAQRIQAQAEKDVIAGAEAAVREARAEQLATIRATKGELATPRQVDFILQLLAERKWSGEGGGFVVGGPTTAAGIEELTKAEASRYITSLKGDY